MLKSNIKSSFLLKFYVFSSLDIHVKKTRKITEKTGLAGYEKKLTEKPVFLNNPVFTCPSIDTKTGHRRMEGSLPTPYERE